MKVIYLDRLLPAYSAREAQATYQLSVAMRQTQNSRPQQLGLASGGVYHASDVTTAAVRSYRTFSPLPWRLLTGALPGRYIFCGTFPMLRAARWALPTALFWRCSDFPLCDVGKTSRIATFCASAGVLYSKSAYIPRNFTAIF